MGRMPSTALVQGHPPAGCRTRMRRSARGRGETRGARTPPRWPPGDAVGGRSPARRAASTAAVNCAAAASSSSSDASARWLQTPATSRSPPAASSAAASVTASRPLLGTDAVAVQAGVDLEVHARRAVRLRAMRADIVQQVDIADPESRSSAIARADLVVEVCEPHEDARVRRRAWRGRRPRSARRTRRTSERPRPTRAGRSGARPWPYASSFTTSMCSAGATSPRMCARLAANASRSTRSTGVTGRAPAPRADPPR